MSSVNLILDLSPGKQPLPNLHSGDTPLLVACRKRNHEIGILLLTHSPKLLLMQDKQYKYSALHLAALSGDYKMIHILVVHIRYLLEQRELFSDSNHMLDYINTERVTPLYTACANNHKDIVKTFIDLQNDFSSVSLIDVNRVFGESKRTLLHNAIMNCNQDIVQTLLSNKDINVNAQAKPSKETHQRLIDSFVSLKSSTRGAVFGSESSSVTVLTTDRLSLLDSSQVGPKKFTEVTIIEQESDMCIGPSLRASVDSKSGKRFCDMYITPLAEACIYGSDIMVQLLLKHRAIDKGGLACKLCRFLLDFDMEQAILSYHCAFELISSIQTKRKKVTTESNLGLMLKWSSMNLPECRREWLNEKMSYIAASPQHITNELAIYNYSVVKAVNLSKNVLTEVPLELFCLPSVTEINLSHNKLTVLPTNPYTCLKASLCGWDCKFLEVLNLSHNRLNELPSCLWMLPNLKELHCHVNSLSTFPSPSESIFEDKLAISESLRYIDLSRNRIEVVPEILWVLNALKELNLSDNQLSPAGLNFPSFHRNNTRTLESASNTTVLMNYCTQSQSKRVSSGFKSAEELSFGFKRNIKVFEHGYSSLCKLIISNNYLTEFPKALACIAPNLQELDVSNNTFEYIDICFIPQLIVTFTARNCKLHHFGNVVMKEVQEFTLANCCSVFDKAVTFSVCPHRNHHQLPFLKDLDLSGNNLTHIKLLYHTITGQSEDSSLIREEIFVDHVSSTSLFYPDLHTLNLERNCLTGLLNPNIGHLLKLDSLLLSGNDNLEALPNELGLLNLRLMDIQNTPGLIDPPQEYRQLESCGNLEHLLQFFRARMRK